MLDRKYHLWTSGNIGDEFHQLLECQNIKGSRNLYIIFGQILQFRVSIIKLENQIKAEKITEVYKVHKQRRVSSWLNILYTFLLCITVLYIYIYVNSLFA